jgi:hypothetical protein
MITPIFLLLSSKGILASAYALRAIACTALLLGLMVRFEIINKKNKIDLQ